MTEKLEIYKCEICGNIVEVLYEGAETLVCCGEPMILIEEKISDEGKEKHVPVIDNNKVKVGSIPHPMQEDHFIEWIEASNGKETSRIFLKFGQKPEAEFTFKPKYARIHCNIHGLWKSEQKNEG